MRKVNHQLSGVVGRPLAHQEADNQFRLLVETSPQVNVADVATAGFFFRLEPALLLGDERPDFIRLDMLKGEVPQPGIHVRLAPLAESDHQIHNRGAMHAGQPGRRSKGVALNQVVKYLDLLLTRKDVCHGRIPFFWGSR